MVFKIIKSFGIASVFPLPYFFLLLCPFSLVHNRGHGVQNWRKKTGVLNKMVKKPGGAWKIASQQQSSLGGVLRHQKRPLLQSC